MTLPFLICASMTFISAAISLGFSISAVLGASDKSRTMAFYACARSVALFTVSVVPFITASIPWALAIACCMTIVQACDAAIGVTLGDRMKTFGPAGTALGNLAAVIWLIHG